MKRLTVILTVSLLSLNALIAYSQQDTTIQFNRKSVYIHDQSEQTTVRIVDYENKKNLEKVYEGVFTDHQSVECYYTDEEPELNIPFMNSNACKKSSLRPHWAGFGIGFATFAQNGIWGQTDGLPLNTNKSNEFMYNILEGILPLGNQFGLTSGFGLDWRSFHLEGNHALIDDNGVTRLTTAPPNVNYTYSRFRTLHLTIPLLVEWQPTFVKRQQRAFVAVGIVGGWNVMSTYRVKYQTINSKKMNEVIGRGLNTNPLTLDFMVQAGYHWFGLYAKYSPIGVFKKDKGADVTTASLGLLFHL